MLVNTVKRDQKCCTCFENNLGLLTYWTPQSCLYTFLITVQVLSFFLSAVITMINDNVNKNDNDNDNQPPKCNETINEC